MGLTIKVRQWQLVQFGTDLAAQVVHGSLNGGVEQEPLQEH